MASMTTTPCALASAYSVAAWRSLAQSGFSTSACLPARTTTSACSRCSAVGLAT